MNIWKQRIISLIYFHNRLVVMGILMAGGCFAFVVAYQFLFKTVEIDMPLEPTIIVNVNQKAVDAVAQWNATMAKKARVEITIPNSAFAIPTPPPER